METSVCMLSRFSHVQLFLTPWYAAHQAPLPMGFSRQEYWSGLPCPPPGDLPNRGIGPVSASVSCIAGRFFITGSLGKPSGNSITYFFFFFNHFKIFY